MRLPMVRIAVLSSALGLLFASASAQDERTCLPVNALEGSKKGDWAFYSVRTEKKRDGKKLHPLPSHLEIAVKNRGGGVASLSAWDSLQPKPREARLGRDDAPRILRVLESFFCDPAPSRSALTVGESKDETRKLGDRELECVKLSFRWVADGSRRDGTFWLSKDVRVLGIVGLELKGENLTQTYTLVGEGTLEGVTWGEAPARNAFGDDCGEAVEVMGAGADAPTLAGTTTTGERFKLGSDKGPVLVHFYSTWNDCEIEIEWLAALKRAFGPSGLGIVGVANVSSESNADWKTYLEKHGADWTSVADTQQSIHKRWRLGKRHEVGSHCTECCFYLVKDGKVLGGHYVVVSELWNAPCSTTSALRHAFPDVSIPDELEPSLGE